MSEDKEGIFTKIRNNSGDIIWRQYFIKRATKKIDVSAPPPSRLFPENMNAEEAAEYLNIEIKTLRNWTSSKKIPFSKIGGTVRYRKSDIDAFLKQNTVTPKSKEKKRVAKYNN
jgi:excisionase family DNA binding protein